MQRLRSTWMALMGGVLLVTLSISAAFGAPPPASEDGPMGLSVAAFVHGLLFDDEAPESDPEEDENEEDDVEEDEALEEEVIEEEDVETEQVEGDSHGACVSEVAHDKAGENDPDDADYANHGERVSEAARVLCWETDEEASEEEVVEEEDVETEQNESDAHGACVSEVAHDKAGQNDPDDADYANHGERVSEAARFLCWGFDVGTDEEPEAEQQEVQEQEVEETNAAADADSTTAGPGQSGQANGHGKANAPGQQKVQSGGGRGAPAWAGSGGPGGRGR